MNNEKCNILFVIFDQLRGDSVGSFKDSVVKTPNLDSVSKDGVTFNNCFVQNPICTPSRCAIMTGLYPHVRGHRSIDHVLSRDENNLFKYLRDYGYWVEWYGKNDVLDKDSFSVSVDNRKHINGWNETYIPNPWSTNHPYRSSFYTGKRSKGFDVDHDECVTNNAIDFINEYNRDKPFCLYLPLAYPHPPYNIEEPYFSMYDNIAIKDPAEHISGFEPKFMTKFRDVLKISELTLEQKKRIIKTYYGMITKTDYLIGKVLEKMKEKNIYDNTLIVITSDHGDYTCDYDLTEKWESGLTDNLLRVPLIIKLPNNEFENSSNADLVESIDIFPTIMEMAEVDTYHHQYGKSLIPLIKGETKEHKDYVFSEGGRYIDEKESEKSKERVKIAIENIDKIDDRNFYGYKALVGYEFHHYAAMIRTTKWKLIKRNKGIDELYCIEKDPKEQINLANDERYLDKKNMLESILLSHYMDTCDSKPFRKYNRDLEEFENDYQHK